MSRASAYVVLVGVVTLVACYYDKSEPDMGTAGATNYINKQVAFELVSQPVKFSFAEQDVTQPDVVEDTAGLPCEGVDCTTNGQTCHPTDNKCVPCYVDADEQVNCDPLTEFCVESANSTDNYCELN